MGHSQVEKCHVSNIQKLHDVIMEWRRVPATASAALVNSMVRRSKAPLLDNNGAHTKY